MNGVTCLFVVLSVVVSVASAGTAWAQSEPPAAPVAGQEAPAAAPEEWVDVPTTPLVTQLHATAEWPEAGRVPQFPLLDYPGVVSSARRLLESHYETWLSYLGPQAAATTLPQNLLQGSGCLEPCDMRKALLIVSPQVQGVYVAMVEEGHVTMRPSLMEWPDEAIAPLKKWLAESSDRTK